MPTVKTQKSECHSASDPDYDVYVDGVYVGHVYKGGLSSTLYYPWTTGKMTFATKREAVASLVARSAAA